VLNFVIVAFVLFMIITGMNQIRRKQPAPPPAPPAPPAPTNKERLLGEIRDPLKAGR
jgi:large conductance mechanosensitive channel